MAEAKITLTLTPGEFDDLRAAVNSEALRARAVVDDRHTDAKIRHEERERAGKLEFILGKLR